MPADVWSAEFRRLVLAAAVSGDLLGQLPLDAELFASAASGQSRSPQQRIAEEVIAYFGKYGVKPLSVFTQLVLEAGARLGPEERAALEREAAAVLALGAPPDERFVRDRARSWVELRRLERGIVQAADTLTREGAAGVAGAREALAAAAAPIPTDTRVRRVLYQSEADARVEAWRRGDEYGERIATGFAALDSVLGGGPTRREAWYFLAPPKGAKTAALLHVAASAARRRFGVYVSTFEMQAVRMALRLDRMFSKSSKDELREDAARLELAIAGLRAAGSGEIVIDEWPPQQPGSVEAVDRRVDEIRRAGGKVDVVVLDYLNIMGASREEREKRHELSRISRDIAALGKNQDVLVWSAALVNRAAVNKRVIRKNDIAEVYEAIAVMDGGVAICGTLQMVRNGLRRLYVAAAREEADEVRAGDYRVDFSRMSFTPADGEVDALPELDNAGNGEGQA